MMEVFTITPNHILDKIEEALTFLKHRKDICIKIYMDYNRYKSNPKKAQYLENEDYYFGKHDGFLKAIQILEDLKNELANSNK